METNRKSIFREHVFDRILLLVGSVGMLADALAMGVFSGGGGEIWWFRLVLIACSGTILVMSFRFPAVEKRLYPLVSGMLFYFVALVVYLNYVHRFGFEYLLMLHVGVILSSIYFRKRSLLLIYLGFSYALVAFALFQTENPFIAPRLLLTRLVMTMACGYGLNMLNRDVLRKLRGSNRRFQMLAENSTDLIAVHDAEGRVEYVNPAARRMLDYTENELRGLNAFSLIHPDDRPVAREAYYKQLFLKGESVQLEYRLVRKDGSSIWVEAVGTPMGTAGRLPMRILTTSRDATERKRAEEESRRYQEKLLRINDELDQFAYIVSHDLKAPLRGIVNLSNFIEEDLGDLKEDFTDEAVERVRGDLEQHLRLMRLKVEQMEQFIEDVLSFSRAGRASVEWGPVDLNALLLRIVDNLALPAGFKVELPGDIPPVMGARVHFEQIFSNLVSNAWKHHDKDQGMIRVLYENVGDFHLLTVSDDGPGIDPRFHERIFEVFQQLQAREQRGGTGVGLAVVRKIVRNVGGNIEVHSQLGEGAEFRIHWPKRPPESLDSGDSLAG